MKKEQIIQEFGIEQLEQRVEFGLCGGGSGAGGSTDPDPGCGTHSDQPECGSVPTPGN